MQPNYVSPGVNSSNSSATAQVSGSSQSSLWRGREVHHSKSTFSIGLQMIMSAIMTLLETVFSRKKDFVVFNENGHPVSKSLNIFQRFFRVLGFYRNTHLWTVGILAQEACFKQNQKWSSGEKKTIINIIDKFNIPGYFFCLPIHQTDFYLGEELLSTGETISYAGNLSERWYSFSIKIIKNGKTIRESVIELEKTTNKRFNITRIQELPLGSTFDELPFRTNSNDILAKSTYLFLSKILNDSPSLEGLDMLNKGFPQYHRVHSLIGGAEVAQTYGFSGEIKDVYVKDGQNIGRPDYLKLEKIRAGDFAKQCKLSKPVSIDFLLD